jgi:hypothetical protein
MLKAAMRGNSVESFDAELWLWFLTGVIRQRWADRKLARPPADSRIPGQAANRTTQEPGVARL